VLNSYSDPVVRTHVVSPKVEESSFLLSTSMSGDPSPINIHVHLTWFSRFRELGMTDACGVR